MVCVMMPNSPDYAVAVLGILQAGAEFTTVNPIYTARKLIKIGNSYKILGCRDVMTCVINY